MNKQAILCFLIKDDEILLAAGNYRPGKITWNGVSGFIEGSEKPEEAAVRELYEEIKVRIYEKDLEQVGMMHLYNQLDDLSLEETLILTIFLCERWQGEPNATESARPKWFGFDDIPYQDMFGDTEKWLPRVLEGEKVIIEVIQRPNDETKSTEILDVNVRNIFE